MRYSEANVFSTRGWQSPVCRVPHELTRYTPSEFPAQASGTLPCCCWGDRHGGTGMTAVGLEENTNLLQLRFFAEHDGATSSSKE